jgi:hypothetical protein
MDDIIIEVLDEASSVIEIYNDDGFEFNVSIAQGPPGPQGPAGVGVPAGIAHKDVLTYDSVLGTWVSSKGALRHTHTQSVAATSWAITHNLGYMPSITVIDSGGNEVEGDMVYNDTNTVTISFSAQMSGIAYLS